MKFIKFRSKSVPRQHPKVPWSGSVSTLMHGHLVDEYRDSSQPRAKAQESATCKVLQAPALRREATYAGANSRRNSGVMHADPTCDPSMCHDLAKMTGVYKRIDTNC